MTFCIQLWYEGFNRSKLKACLIDCFVENWRHTVHGAQALKEHQHTLQSF